MSDPKPPAPEKGARPRPFGPFLLFLTVLVVVLIAFGGSQASKTKDLSQDQFLYYLNVGEVSTLKTLDQGDVVGDLDSGTSFRASFHNLETREAEFQQLKAAPTPTQIPASRLEAILDPTGDPLFFPKEAKHLTTFKYERPKSDDPEGEEGGGSQLSPTQQATQADFLLVTGTAAPLRSWGSSADMLSNTPGTEGGLMRFKIVGSSVSLEKKLAAMGVQIEALTFDITPDSGMRHTQTGTTLGTVLMIWGPWLLILFVFMLFMRQMRNQGGGSGVMSFGRSRATLYNKENDTGVSFSDVAGAQEAKAEVREVVEFLKNPERFTTIGGRIPRGVMLVGPPGCGKTLLAKAIAGEAEVPFYSISGSDFVEMFVGVGASRVRDLFKQARENSPCIIFLDEIDAVGRRRGSGMGGGHDEREQTLNAILVEMDGFGTDDGVIVVASTNRPDVLDPALLRPGRFDREVTIDLPDLEGRLAILKVHLKKVKLADEIDTALLAKSTPGYSGADLAAIVNEAAIMAVLADCDTIHMEHLEEATTKVRYGRKKTSMKLGEDDLRETAYHESGHTLVAAKLEHADPPHKVTIVPRGRSLGSTQMLPERESYSYGRKKMLAELAVLFGGRAAEELYCGDISSGASSDIHRATRLARSMVIELGMSDRVGPVNYAEREGSDFLGTEVMGSKRHSEETARVIDEEIERILREGYALALKILKEEKDAVERLTQALLKYETLDRGEIESLIEGADPETLRPEPPKEEDPAPPAVEATSDAEAKASDKDDLPGFSGEAGLSPA